MDDARFDSLTRSLTDAQSRRGALGGLLLGTLGLLGGRSEEVAAHDPIKKCKKKSGDAKKKCLKKAKKKCLKKAKKHNAQHASETPPPPPPGSPPTCASHNECASALCSSGTCQACSATPNNCGTDASGRCYCSQPAPGGT